MIFAISYLVIGALIVSWLFVKARTDMTFSVMDFSLVDYAIVFLFWLLIIIYFTISIPVYRKDYVVID